MIKYIENSCDACGSNEYEEIKCLRKYTKNQPIHVCKNCGLIYVKKRRPPKKVADKDTTHTTTKNSIVMYVYIGRCCI